MRRAEPHRLRLSHAQPQNKNGTGGPGPAGWGRPHRALSTREPPPSEPSEHSELSEAVARTGVLFRFNSEK
jgi:hypothetical protein